VNGKTFDATAPMPSNWTKKQLELASRNLCKALTQVIQNNGKLDVNESNEDDEQFDEDIFSDKSMMCEFNNMEIVLTVPMPDSWSEELKDKTCLTICKSMREAKPIALSPTKKKEAVCDTDYNCEVLWEKYHQYDITKLITAPDNRQRKGVNVLEITCENDPVVRYTATEAELPSICQAPIKIIEAMEDEAKTQGEATEFSLNWYQLEVAIEANMIPIDRTGNDSPTTLQFLDFMKAHPEAEISGVFHNAENAEKACKMINQPSDKNSQCYKDNIGIQITDLTIRFGDSNEMPKWFTDFCENADNNSELGRGFWNCSW